MWYLFFSVWLDSQPCSKSQLRLVVQDQMDFKRWLQGWWGDGSRKMGRVMYWGEKDFDAVQQGAFSLSFPFAMTIPQSLYPPYQLSKECSTFILCNGNFQNQFKRRGEEGKLSCSWNNYSSLTTLLIFGHLEEKRKKRWVLTLKSFYAIRWLFFFKEAIIFRFFMFLSPG